MPAKLAALDDYIAAGVEATSARGGGSIVPGSVSDKPQGGRNNATIVARRELAPAKQ